MIEAFGSSNVGCKRTSNEDRYALAPAQQLYVVSDGIGGAAAGEIAAQLAVDAVLENVSNTDARGNATLLAAFQAAHQRVASASADPDKGGMGCTLVAALVHRMMLFMASVGDSRAYVFASGACQCVSADQTWVNEIGRKLGLSFQQLEQHPYRHVLTAAIGIGEFARVKSYSLPIARGMQFLLCTDGLHDVVSEETIVQTMLSRQRPEAKCRSLIAAAMHAGAPDNVTVVVADLDSYRNDLLASVARSRETS